MYNLVELCDYGDSKDRIIRDVLIIGCNSDKAKDKIVRQGEKIKLEEVIEILQIEDSTRQKLSEMNSTGQKNYSSINYVSYDKKKSKSKKKTQTNPNHSSSSSSGQKQDSTGPGKQCYRCKKPYTKCHENVCEAQNAICDGCGVKGHNKIACKKSGNFPQKSHSNPQNSSSTGRMNIAAAIKEPALNADFFNEKGYPKEYRPKQMNVLSGTSDDTLTFSKNSGKRAHPCAVSVLYCLSPMSRPLYYRPQGKVMFSQVSVCPQSASRLPVNCLIFLRRGRYASYWNAFLFD